MRRVIAIVGMPGSGKTEVADFFKKKGASVLRFGSVIDEGIEKEGLPWTPENNKYYREKIRKEFGMAAVAVKMLPKIKEVLEKNEEIVIDGLYSWEEYLYLKNKVEKIILLCVFARPSIRYERLENRQERKFTEKEIKERDKHEIESTNKGGPIAIADFLVKNEETKEDLYKELEKFLQLLRNDLL